MDVAKAKIMVVEDEKITALEIQHRLRGMGYNVMASASSGNEAIEKASKTHPDIILMDIKLYGEMDGIQVASRICSKMDVLHPNGKKQNKKYN